MMLIQLVLVIALKRSFGSLEAYVGIDTTNCSKSNGVWKFECDSGQKLDCIRRCDDSPHCLDNSDERGCPECTATTGYICKNSTKCVSYYSLCDGTTHCEGGDDEDKDI